MRKQLFKLGLLTGALVVAMGGNAFAAPPTGSNGFIDVVRISGSDTTYFAEQRLANLYNGSPGCELNQLNDGSASANFRGCRSPQPAGVDEAANYDHDNITNDYPIGSGSGIGVLCNQSAGNRVPADAARSSRDKSSSDCAGLTFTSYAKDGVGIENFRNIPISASQGSPAAGCQIGQAQGACTGTPVTNLTSAQARGIWSECSIRDWRQLTGGPTDLADPVYAKTSGAYDYTSTSNLPIFVFTAQSGSGTRNTFDKFLGGGTTSTPSTPCLLDSTNTSATTYDPTLSNVIFENDARPIAERTLIRVGGTGPGVAPGGPGPSTATKIQSQSIFFTSYGRYVTSPFAAAGGSFTAVNGISINPATILTNSYPITRNLWRVSTGANGAVNAFNDWTCKPSAQHTIDPQTGRSYFSEIAAAISASGFVRQPANAGRFCVIDNT